MKEGGRSPRLSPAGDCLPEGSSRQSTCCRGRVDLAGKGLGTEQRGRVASVHLRPEGGIWAPGYRAPHSRSGEGSPEAPDAQSSLHPAVSLPPILGPAGHPGVPT